MPQMQYTFDRYWGAIATLSGMIVAPAYSGRGDAVNNPADEAQHAVGPIPAGNYLIDGPFNMGPLAQHWEHPTLGMGPIWKLIPDDKTKQFMLADERDPDSFYIHGDNQKHNHSASEGCVITPGMYRRQFQKGDKLRVI